MATEIANFVHLQATISIDADGNANLCGAAGVRELIRDELGEYTLVPEVLLANRVPLGVPGLLPDYRSVPYVNVLIPWTVDPLTGSMVRVLPVPINVPASAGTIPGTLKIYVKNSEGEPIDLTFFSVMVLDLPQQQ